MNRLFNERVTADAKWMNSLRERERISKELKVYPWGIKNSRPRFNNKYTYFVNLFSLNSNSESSDSKGYCFTKIYLVSELR